MKMSLINRGLFILFLSTSAYAGDARGLCHADEDVVFSCDLEKKVAAVCASHGVTATSGYIQYRFGTLAKLEFVYPSELKPPRGHFFFSHTMFSGGDGSRIRFKNHEHEYFFFSKSVRTNFEPDGNNDPQDSAGIFTRFQNNFSKVRMCLDWDAMNGPGTDAMDREEFDDDAP